MIVDPLTWATSRDPSKTFGFKKSRALRTSQSPVCVYSIFYLTATQQQTFLDHPSFLQQIISVMKKWHRNVSKYGVSPGYIPRSEIRDPKYIFKMMANISKVSTYVPVCVPTVPGNGAHSPSHCQARCILKTYLIFISFASHYLPVEFTTLN